ncbi:MAG: sulfite exporter TauE/SafE family protein [Armatimonadetes bacterium]|nr:sulfite exporter TauE/SafE family protein [Armatimonadota bacterium]
MQFISACPLVAVTALSLIGFSVGVCGAFFGVGGAFIVTPALNVLGFPMVYAIGTDLAHMAGKSVVATLRHRRLGNIDFRAAALLVLGSVPGVRIGAETIIALEKIGRTDVYVRPVYMIVLLAIGLLMLRETRRKAGEARGGLARRLGRLRIPPMVSLPHSGISSISVWVVAGIGLATGFLAGFLGVGAGFIRVPALLYVIGMPTKIAIGTDLVEILFSGAYGSYLYGMTGHVDVTAALIMLVGASIGSQIGAVATQHVESAGIRRLFALTVLGTGVAVVLKHVHWNLGAAVVLFGLGFAVTSTIIWRLVRSLVEQERRAVERR